MKAKMKLLSWKSWLSSFHSRCFQMIDHFFSALYSQTKAPGACDPSGLLAQILERKLGYKSATALSSFLRFLPSLRMAWQLSSRWVPLFHIVPELTDSLCSKAWLEASTPFFRPLALDLPTLPRALWWLPNNPISRIQKPKSVVQSWVSSSKGPCFEHSNTTSCWR